MPITAGIMGGITAAGSIGGALIQGNAASNAASAQQQAAQQVIQMANNASKTASGDVSTATNTANTSLTGATGTGNALIQGTLQQQLTALQPYIQNGQLSMQQVMGLLSGNGPLAQQFQFNPTTSPQLQFEQQQANQALQRQFAANGLAPSGGTVRASDALNTGLASTYLNQAFNQALSTYDTNRQNVLTRLQGLTNLTGLGFNATGAAVQDLGVAGQLQNSNIQNNTRTAAENTIQSGVYSGNSALTAAQIGEQATIGAANAQSASDLAQGKAWGNAVNTLGGTASSLYGLSQSPNWGGFGGGGGGGGGTFTPMGPTASQLGVEPDVAV